MQRIDENKVTDYIKKHVSFRKWLAFALCISLFTGTVTLYMMNKPATAMTEEGAQQVGLVLETADSAYEQQVIEQVVNKDSDTDGEEKKVEVKSESTDPAPAQATEGSGEPSSDNNEGTPAAASTGSTDESAGTTSSSEEVVTSSSTEASTVQEDDPAKETSVSTGASSAATESTTVSTGAGSEAGSSSSSASATESSSVATGAASVASSSASSASSTESSSASTGASSEAGSTASSASAAASSSASTGAASAATSSLTAANTGASLVNEETALKADIKLTVSYVDTKGEALKDEKEISISESLDFTTEAPEIEGYTFKEAAVGTTAITKLTVKKTDDGFKYYEATLSDGTTEEIKEDKIVVLTYEGAEAEKTVVKLTAKYVDENGVSIADEEALEVKESLKLEDKAKEIDGYTFKAASLDGKEFTVITSKKDDKENVYFELTLKDETVQEVKEDKTLTLTYVKDAEVDSTIKLTAKYVDKDSNKVAEDKELNITKEKEFKKDTVDTIEGYFFMDVTFDGKKIAKITPVFEEETEVKDAASSSDTSKSDTAAASNEAETRKVKNFTFTTSDGEEITVDKDAEVVFNYVKATTQTEFKFEDAKVTVNATTKVAGAFPEGTVVKVTAVDKTTNGYNYDAYMEVLNSNAEEIENTASETKTEDASLALTDVNEDNSEEKKKFDETNTLLYDIAFMYDDKEFQPAEGAVTISIEFKENKLSEELAAITQEDIAVVHLPIKEEVKEENEIETTEKATEIKAEDIEVITLKEATAEVGTEEKAEKVEFEADGFSIFAVLRYQNHSSGTDTYETVLGDAVNYGIVAKNLNQICHAQTNFATITFDQEQGQNTGNDMTNYAEQTFLVAEPVSSFHISGYPAYFIVPEEYADRVGASGNCVIKLDTSYSREQLEKTVNRMLEYTRAASADLATRNNSRYDDSSHPYNDNQKTCYDFTKLGKKSDNNTYYVNLDETTYKSIMSGDEKFFIKKWPGQTIVFNVNHSGYVDFYKYSIYNHETDKYVDSASIEGTREDPIARTIIWNFIDAEQVTCSGSVAGVFISGREDAKWICRNSSSGWVAFADVDVSGGEWHNTYTEIKKISSTAQFEAYKHINGEPADVSGFTFKLDINENGTWTNVQTKNNEKHNIIFDPIEYGEVKSETSKYFKKVSLNESNPKTEFIYRISEENLNNSLKDDYRKDQNIYYAKVQVSLSKEILNTNSETAYYKVSAPKYYLDEGCTQALTGIPIFNNETTKYVGFHLYKYINSTEEPDYDKQFSFKVEVLYRDYGNNTYCWEIAKGGANVPNYGSDILYSVGKDDLPASSHSSQKLYFRVTENPTEEEGIIIDNKTIIVEVVNPFTRSEVINYYGLDSTADYDLSKQLFANYLDNKCQGVQITPAFNNIRGAIASIQVYKHYSGSEWTVNDSFEFKIERVGFKDSSGIAGNLGDQPMPQIGTASTDGNSRVITVNGADSTKNNGVYSKEVSFGTIQFNNPGQYVYQLTEISGSRSDIKYDTKKIFAKVTVSESMGTNVEYFSSVECLDSQKLSEGERVFNNSKKQFLHVKKEWTSAGQKLNDSPTQMINVKIYRNGTSENELMKWKIESTEIHEDSTSANEVLTFGNGNWDLELLLAPIASNDDIYYVCEVDDDGNPVTSLVTYKSSGEPSSDWTKVPVSVSNGVLSITIENELGGNVLPSTGGVGEIPYMAVGLGTTVAALLGSRAYRKKKDEEDQE